MTETPARPGHPLITLSRRGLLALGGAAGVGGLLSACGSGRRQGGLGRQGSGTIRALFMQQAAYSEDDVRKMTADFQAANPKVKVEPTSWPTRHCTTRSSPRRPPGPTTSCSST